MADFGVTVQLNLFVACLLSLVWCRTYEPHRQISFERHNEICHPKYHEKFTAIARLSCPPQPRGNRHRSVFPKADCRRHVSPPIPPGHLGYSSFWVYIRLYPSAHSLFTRVTVRWGVMGRSVGTEHPGGRAKRDGGEAGVPSRISVLV